MYFLPRNNRFYSWMVGIKPLHLYAITFGLGSAIVAIWLFGIYFMLSGMVLQHQGSIKLLRDQNIQLKQTDEACKQLETSTRQMKEALQSYIHPQSASQDFQEAMLFLINQAASNGMTMQTCSADSATDKDWYIDHAASIDVAGSLPHVLAFVQAVTSSVHLISVENISMAQGANNQFNAKCILKIMTIKNT